MSAAWSWRWVGLGTMCGLVVEMGGAGHRVRPGRGGGWGWASCAAWSWRWMGLGTDHGTRAGHRPRHAKQWGWASATTWGLGIDYGMGAGHRLRDLHGRRPTPAAQPIDYARRTSRRTGRWDFLSWHSVRPGRGDGWGWASTTACGLGTNYATCAGGDQRRRRSPSTTPAAPRDAGRTMGSSFLATLSQPDWHAFAA